MTYYFSVVNSQGHTPLVVIQTVMLQMDANLDGNITLDEIFAYFHTKFDVDGKCSEPWHNFGVQLVYFVIYQGSFFLGLMHE